MAKIYKKSYRKKGYKKSTDKKQWNAIKKLQLQVGAQEYKNHFTKITASATGVTPAVFSLVSMAKGNDQNEREGNEIAVTQIYFNSLVKISAAAANTSLRYVIFNDRQPNAVATTATDLFEDNTVTDRMVSAINPNGKYRFQIYYNKLVRLTISNGNAQCKFFKRFKKPIIIRYNNLDNGTVADIETNNLQIMVFSDEATNVPTITHSVRISYIDN